MLVAQSLAAVAELDYNKCAWGEAKVPQSVYRQVAFMRVWCLVELMAAKMAGKAVVMMCGSAMPEADSADGYKFVADSAALRRLQWLVDVATAEASDPKDLKRIMAEIEATVGMAALSHEIAGWISGAFAAEAEADDFPAIAAAVRLSMLGELGPLEALSAGELAAAVRVAAALGAEATLAWLLERGSPADEFGSTGFTALMNAARAGRAGVVPALVGGGAEVDKGMKRAGFEGYTALISAVEAGRLEAVEALLKAGASVDKPRGDGATPLFVSAQNGFADVAVALLKAGAPVDTAFEDGLTPLIASATQGHADVVAVLLAAGVSVNAAEDDGCTALYMAAQGGHLEVVKRLLVAEADVDHATNDDDDDFGTKSDPSVLAGPRPLFVAAWQGHTAVAKLLLEAGADRSKMSPWGTAAEFAARHGHVQLAQMLS